MNGWATFFLFTWTVFLSNGRLSIDEEESAKGEPAYKEDKEIQDFAHVRSPSPALKDYLRLMWQDGTGYYSQLVYDIFFSTESDIDFSFHTEIPKKFKKIIQSSEIDFMQNIFSLSDEERRLLTFYYRRAVYQDLGRFCDNLEMSSREILFTAAGIPSKVINSLTNSNSRLRSYGFIGSEDFDINPNLLDAIESQDFNLYLGDLLKPIETDSAYEIESFSVPEDKDSVNQTIISSKNPCSILLYGAPGSGKTEYAKSLVKSAGKKAVLFRNDKESTDKETALFKLNAVLNIKNFEPVIIVDEAENVLRTQKVTFFGPMPTGNKGIVNKMFENSSAQIIWIVNSLSSMDESTLRRFTFSTEFAPMSETMLEKVAVKKMENLEVSGELKSKISKLLSQYQITGASAENVVKTIGSMNFDDEEKILKTAGTVIKENSRLLYGRAKMRQNVAKTYELSVLNASRNPEQLVKMVENSLKFAEKNRNCEGTETGVRMLFYGLSGTGKTEFARYLGEKLGKKVLLKRASDILGMYVGQSEKNIAQAFAEAEAQDMILLFDEADSFFCDRNGAEHSWERTQVNEFLTQMEEFGGILICTTNLRKIMDPAMERRFHIMVEFKPLESKGIKKLLEKFFPSYDFTEKQIEKIAGYSSATPGDFKKLYGTVRFMNEEEVDSAYIIEELCKIQRDKNDEGEGRKIGFGA